MANQAKLTVILHADVVGSTKLVHQNEQLAHERIQSVFRRFAEIISAAGGTTHEIRGDALVAEFGRVSDAASAALEYQAENAANNETLGDGIRPALRIGIALGEVIIADNTLTGAGVVLAQRIEQLAPPDGTCISAAIREALPGRLALSYEDLGEREIKGFDQMQRAYVVSAVPPTLPAEALSQSESDSVPTTNGSTFTGTSLVILPFENKSADADGEFLADGLTEDITTAMSGLRWLMVIARPSAMAIASRTMDVKEVGSELGVEYVVTGTVRKAGTRIRVTATLNDARSGRQIWANRHERVIDDIFDVQDDLTRSIAAELAPELTVADLDAIQRTPPQNLNAWEAYQRGLAEMLHRSDQSFANAHSCFEAAIEHDPRFASAYAATGSLVWLETLRGIVPSETGTERMFSLAAMALDLDPKDSVAHVVRGLAYFLRREYDASLHELDAALAFNPSSAWGLAMRGGVNTMSGISHEQGLLDVQAAERLSPVDPLGRQARLSTLAFAHLQLGHFEESARYGEEAFRAGAFQGVLYGVAACVGLGDDDRARKRVSELMERHPNLSMESLSHSTVLLLPRNEFSDRYRRLLEKGGVPISPSE